MSLEAININKYRILPGQSKEIILNTYQLASRTNIDIPVFVFRSVKPGPVVLLQAGMHGDEKNGIESLRFLLKKEEIDWGVDNNFLQHFKDLGLEPTDDYEEGDEYVSRL
jgi:hypothetical protein